MSDLILFFLALLFVPGILWAYIDARFTPGDWPKFSFFIASSFLFGIISYFATGMLYIMLSNYDWFKLQFDIVSLIDIALANFDGNAENAKVIVARDLLDDVLMSILTSIGLAAVWFRMKYTKRLASLFTTNKVVYENTQKVLQTGRESSLWLDTFARESQGEFDYARIVDFDRGFVYIGFVDGISEHERVREILLKDVTVTKFTANEDGKGVQKYSIAFLYLSFTIENVWIEFPNPEQTERRIQNG